MSGAVFVWSHSGVILEYPRKVLRIVIAQLIRHFAYGEVGGF